jgi:hypothetical protein
MNERWYAYIASGIAIITTAPIEGPCLGCRDESKDVMVRHGKYLSNEGYWVLPEGTKEEFEAIVERHNRGEVSING